MLTVCVCLCAAYVQVGSSQTGAEVVASRPEISVLLPDHLQHQLPSCLKEEVFDLTLAKVCLCVLSCNSISVGTNLSVKP